MILILVVLLLLVSTTHQAKIIIVLDPSELTTEVFADIPKGQNHTLSPLETFIFKASNVPPSHEHVLRILDVSGDEVLIIRTTTTTMEVAHIQESVDPTESSIKETTHTRHAATADINLRIRPIADTQGRSCGFVVYDNWVRYVFPCGYTTPKDYSNRITKFTTNCPITSCLFDTVAVLPSYVLPFVYDIGNMYSATYNSIVIVGTALGNFTVDIANANYPNDINFRMNVKKALAGDANRKVHFNSYKKAAGDSIPSWGETVVTPMGVKQAKIYRYTITNKPNQGMLVTVRNMETAVEKSYLFPHRASSPLNGYQKVIVSGDFEMHKIEQTMI